MSWLDDIQADIAAGRLRAVSDAEWRAEWQAHLATLDREAELLASAYDYDVEALMDQIIRRTGGGWGQYLIPALRRALIIADNRRSK